MLTLTDIVFKVKQHKDPCVDTLSISGLSLNEFQDPFSSLVNEFCASFSLLALSP